MRNRRFLLAFVMALFALVVLPAAPASAKRVDCENAPTKLNTDCSPLISNSAAPSLVPSSSPSCPVVAVGVCALPPTTGPKHVFDPGLPCDASNQPVTDADKQACAQTNKRIVERILGTGVVACAEHPVNCVMLQISEVINTANDTIMREVATWWIRIPSDSPENVRTSWMVRGALGWIALVVAVAAVMWQGVVMIMSRKANPLLEVGRGLFLMSLWGAIGITGTGIALHLSDRLAIFFLDYPVRFSAATGNAIPAGGMPEGVMGFLQTVQLASASLQTTLLLNNLFMLAFLIASFAQYCILAFREATLVILSGTLVLAAAGSITQATRAWLPKVISWMLALICWKPVAALCYTVAFYMHSKAQTTTQLLQGLMLMVVAIFALPALMKMFTVFTGTIQQSQGGGIAGFVGVATNAALYSRVNEGRPTGAAPGGGNGGGAAPPLPTGSSGDGSSSSRSGGPSLPAPSGGGGGGGGGFKLPGPVNATPNLPGALTSAIPKGGTMAPQMAAGLSAGGAGAGAAGGAGAAAAFGPHAAAAAMAIQAVSGGISAVKGAAEGAMKPPDGAA